jgi:PAS domain S-box-containing protein
MKKQSGFLIVLMAELSQVTAFAADSLLGQAPLERLPSWLHLVLAVALVLGALLAAWAYTLRRLVKAKTISLSQALENLALQKNALDQHSVVSTVNANARIVYANEKILAASGYTGEELLGQKHAILLSDQYPADFIERILPTATSASPWRGDLCLRARDARLYWINATIAPYQTEAGEAQQWIIVGNDVSQRKADELELIEHRQHLKALVLQKTADLERTLEALRASEENHRVLLEESSDLIFKFDGEGNFLYVNHEYASNFARRPHEIIGKNLWDIFPKDEADKRFAIIKAAIAATDAIVLPIRVATAHGERHFLTTAKAIFGKPGNPAAVLCISKNVTELRRAEEAQRLAQEKLQRIADTIPGTVYQVAATGPREWKFLYLSRGVIDLYEINPEDVLQDASVLTRCILPEDREDHWQSVQRSYREFSEWEHWHRIMTSSGKIKWVRGRSSPQKLADGTMVWTGLLVDVTERKRIEEAAKASSRAKSEFLANMSHEIRTPMNAILGLTGMLQRRTTDPGQVEKLEKIAVAGRHLLGIINAILDLSKIEEGKFSLEVAPLDLQAVLGNVITMVSELANAKNLTLHADIGRLPENCLGDAIRLQQALLNYAGNAVKFTSAGSIVLRARMVDENENGALVRFEVQDTGIGIAPEALSRIFDSFEQADSSTSRLYGGTGLGLAITSKIAWLMGGEVGVSSKPGFGSTFWFTARLPFPSLDSASKEPGSASALETTTLRGRHLLVVDDNEFNLEVARELLCEAGIIVEVATDASQALEKMRSRRFDWVLMDIQMPGMDGMTATRCIRQDSSMADTCVIALTANALAEDRSQYLAAGMSDVLTKPVDPQKMYVTLLKWLEPAARGDLAAEAANSAAIPNANTDATGEFLTQGYARWDTAVFAKMLGDDVAMQRRLLANFLPNAHNQCHAISRAVDARLWLDAANVSHRLKSAARTVGAMRLGALCEALERAGRQDDGANCQLLCRRMNEEVGKIGDVMGNWLDVAARPAPKHPRPDSTLTHHFSPPA